MSNCIAPERMTLFCPKCGGQHEDLGEWASRPHRTHRCLFCKHEWAPHPYTTVGVAMPEREGHAGIIVPHAVFSRMHEYSRTMPTGPKPGRYWRRRTPHAAPDRAAEHYLAVVIPGPEGADYDLIVWRRLYVAEWLIVDALLSAGTAA